MAGPGSPWCGCWRWSELGTRALMGVTFGPLKKGKTRYAPDLFGCLRPGMVLLADRNFAVKDLVTEIAETGGDLLIRCRNSGQAAPADDAAEQFVDLDARRGPDPGGRRADPAGDLLGGGRRTSYRLITTLDHHRYPGAGDRGSL